MNTYYLRKVNEILDEVQYATLATVSADGAPYNAPVFTAYDHDLNLYWSSSQNSQHSKNIADSGKVFIVIYNSSVAQGTGWGVYIEAEAATAAPSETERALLLLGSRRGRPFDNMPTFTNGGPQRIYKAKPLQIWINDAEKDDSGEYVEDHRVALDLPAVISRLNGTQG